MTATEYIEKLMPDRSYWLMAAYGLIRLNNVPIEENNVYIVFKCESCDGYHSIPLTELKWDRYGRYLACCPENAGKNKFEEYICMSVIPNELRELFETTIFRCL